MRQNFDKAFDFIMKWEGGYVNDKNDSGGETNFGISKSSYPNLDIKGLTADEAKVIYLSDYWIPAGCDMLQHPFDALVFDTAVNMGIARAKDIMAMSDTWESYVIYRQFAYGAIAGKYPTFISGWTNRVKDLYIKIKKSMV